MQGALTEPLVEHDCSDGVDEGCLSGCFWGVGGICSRCGTRLRCGACGRFVTVATLSSHIDDACPVKWIEYEGG